MPDSEPCVAYAQALRLRGGNTVKFAHVGMNLNPGMHLDRADSLLRPAGPHRPAFFLEDIMPDAPEARSRPTFQGRKAELEALRAGPTPSVRVLNYYGEKGIGKSRLLGEGAQQLGQQANSQAVLIDLADLGEQRAGRPQRLFELLGWQAPDLAIPPGSPDDMALRLVDRLDALSARQRITLLFDTTEKVQDDPEFWPWFERCLLSPLVSEDNVLLVLAGKLPAPIRLVEVRRYLKVVALPPLGKEAQAMVRELLAADNGCDHLGQNPPGRGAADALGDLVLEFSHGHPLLTERIAAELTGPLCGAPLATVRRRIAEEVVLPFINAEIFPFKEDLAAWRPLMEWASVLDWFDATVLYRFAKALNGPLPSEIEWQYEFLRVMAQLRAPYAVVKWERTGYTLVGTVKSIVAGYLREARRAEYLAALRTAVSVFNGIVGEFFADDPQAGKLYSDAARSYERHLKEVEHGKA